MDEHTQDQDQSKQKQTFRRWYKDNGSDLNAKRRERYANDPEYREKAKAISRRARERRKARGGVAETSVTRVINGVEVELFRVSAAAEMIDKSPDTIRLWCRKGWVPAGEPGEHRLYRMHQIKLLKTLAYTIDKYRYAKDYKAVLKKCVGYVHENWN